MVILGIETSCDETAAAVVEIDNNKLSVLSSVLSSQVAVQKQYGGVVPEVAAREHMKNMLPIIYVALEKAGKELEAIDQIAAAQGPGLATSLMVGLETGKALAYTLKKPFVPVNHMAGHVWSTGLPKEHGMKVSFEQKFPFVALLVSGGHTELLLIKSINEYELLGRTVDDAVGEAFDKVARMLGLGYPGGPQISKQAAGGDAGRFKLPRPMLHADNYNFSFAGLKTAVLYALQKIDTVDEQVVRDMAAGFETAAVEVLVKKTIRAAREYGVDQVVIAGGVSANRYLRAQMQQAGKDLQISFPELMYTGDNAAMIAAASYFVEPEKEYRILRALPNLTLV